MDDYEVTELPNARRVVFVTSTMGQGDPPANVRLFWRFLLRKSLPAESLSRLAFACFGLGDSHYQKYNVVAKKLAKEAQPLSARRERKPQLGLVSPHPSPTPVREDPALAWRVEWEADEAPPSTRLELTSGERGLRFTWGGFDGPIPSRQTKGPEIRLVLVHGEDRWPLLEAAVPYTVGDLAAYQAAAAPAGGPTVTGRIDMQWSPDGERVLLLLEAGFGAPGDGNDETAQRQAHYWLRACGPRIRIVEAGAGQRAARRAALTLADQGYPVAEMALREPPVAESKVLHRRGHEGGASLARAVSELLSLSGGSKASRGHRATITIVLGQDYAD